MNEVTQRGTVYIIDCATLIRFVLFVIVLSEPFTNDVYNTTSDVVPSLRKLLRICIDKFPALRCY